LEETQIECKIQKLLATVQLFFKRDDGKPFHEIGFYYLLNPKKDIKTINFNFEENDKGKIRHHQFRWVDLDTLESMDVRPASLKNVIKNNSEREHIVQYEG